MPTLRCPGRPRSWTVVESSLRPISSLMRQELEHISRDDNNRRLVTQGLGRIRARRTRNEGRLRALAVAGPARVRRLLAQGIWQVLSTADVDIQDHVALRRHLRRDLELHVHEALR